MRSLAVVFHTEGVEAPLLHAQRRPRWSRGFRLERPMHSLMASILLRRGRFDQLWTDPQFHPPDAERGESTQRRRGKGCPVVRPDSLGETGLLEEVGEDGFGLKRRRLWQRLAREEVAGETVDDRERVTASPGAEGKMPFEVRRPDIVGSEDRRSGAARMPRLGMSAPGPDQAMPLKEGADRARCRKRGAWMTRFEIPENLPRSPGRVPAASGEQQRGELRVDGPRRGARATRLIAQRAIAIDQKAREPFVAHSPTDAVAGTERGHRIGTAEKLIDELAAFGHRGLHSPGHRAPPEGVVTMPKSVTYVSGLDCYLCPRSVPPHGANRGNYVPLSSGVIVSGANSAFSQSPRAGGESPSNPLPRLASRGNSC